MIMLARAAAVASMLAIVEDTSPLADFFDTIAKALHALLALPPQASAAAARIDGLQYFEFVSFWVIGAAVLGAAVLFVVRYRRRPGDETRPTAEVRAPLWLELTFSIGLLGLFVLWWVIGFRQFVDVQTARPGATEVYVTARQWVWKFAYADGPTSAGVLYVPLGRPVRLMITSRDVIHSFFVPAFRVKQDAVPGRFTSIGFEATRTGRFEILCAEFCGTGHSRMWGQVVVLPADRFDAWLAGGEVSGGTAAPGVGEPGSARSQEPAPRVTAGETLARRGQRIAADRGCLRCHRTDDVPASVPAYAGPSWSGLYGSRVALANGDTVTADVAYLTESMMDPEAKIVAGYAPVMPSFQGLITPAETAAIVEYIESLARVGRR